VTPPVGARERRSAKPAAVRKRESVRRLKEALAGDRLVLYYQPIVDARTLRPSSAEALLRWKDAARDREEIPRLVAAAERSPVIFALERWAVGKGCGDAARWRERALPDLRVNINVSAREFRGGRVHRALDQTLRAHCADPSSVALEITETSALHDPALVAPVLEDLKQRGHEVWLDDFGTGHSSLAWLRHLPIHGVKIPADFVRPAPTDARVATITAAIIALAHELGLRVVAEGVERPEHRDWLLERGCDAFQGYLFHEPMSAATMAARLAV
jgi:EAL domain-containing protein (putative c-di-GMP-specific phosphodiesterase class I)